MRGAQQVSRVCTTNERFCKSYLYTGDTMEQRKQLFELFQPSPVLRAIGRQMLSHATLQQPFIGIHFRLAQQPQSYVVNGNFLSVTVTS